MNIDMPDFCINIVCMAKIGNVIDLLYTMSGLETLSQC